MQNVPFYSNHQDRMRCMLSVYGMVIAHFLHKHLTWAELIELTGYQPKRAAWTVKPLTTLVTEYGLSVRMIEPFNYKRFASLGIDYFYDLYDNEEVEWYKKNSNIEGMKPYITQFLATVRPECRRATLQDIDDMLDDGRLIFVALNSRILNGKEGFSSHAVLVIGKDGDDYIIHDPGLPPRPNRRVSRKRFWKAMGGDQNTAEVTGFKLRFAGLRLDQYVVREKPSLSRAYATRLINEGKVLINGMPTKAGYKLRDGNEVTIDYDEANQPDVPEIDLPVLYEDDDCIVINKPAGVLTHNKGVRFVEATVASFVRSRINQAVGSAERAGIVHRLDRATSGVIIAAKTPEALSFLQKQFHDRTVEKTYSAVIRGSLEPVIAVIDMPIERNPKAPATFRVGPNGKVAQTQYELLKSSNGYSLLELKPKTGRTHQLRVHLAHLKHPIVGDTLYGGEPAERLYLHAHQLIIKLPDGQDKTFTAPIPPELEQKAV